MKKQIIFVALLSATMLLGFNELGKTDLPQVQKMSLSTDKDISGKPFFELNGKKFYPVIYMCSWREATPVKVEQLLKDGFNMLNLGIDGPDAESKNKDLITTLERLKEQHIPVMVELLHGAPMSELREPNKASWNMQFSNGDYVKYFPDYANPTFREEWNIRMGHLLDFLKPYYGNPVVAFSIGHTDSFHVPDGEVHYAFQVKEVEGDATSLPYGRYALEGYRKFVKNLGYTPQDLGAKSEIDLVLPTSSKSANNPLHWSTWIQYRRFYVKDFVNQFAQLVKTKSHLPITAHLDINFSRIEKYACPLNDYSDILDFIGLYYYGLADQSKYRIPELMAYVYRHYSIRGKPMISYLELSSALGKIPTPAKDYMETSLPYVSGFITTDFLFGGLDQKMLQWRYNGFVQTIQEIQRQKLDSIFPPSSQIAILLSSQDPGGLENLNIPSTLADLQIPFDVIYEDDLVFNKIQLQNYKVVYTPPGQELMRKDKRIQNTLTNYKQSQGLWVNEGQEKELWNYLVNHTGLLRPEIEKVIKTAVQLLQNLESMNSSLSMDTSNFLPITNDFIGWENSLGSFAKVENNRILSVKKINKNMQGIKFQKLLSIPFIFAFTLTAQSGDPRLTLLSNGEGLSIGQDKKGWIGIYLNDKWLPFLFESLGEPYQYLVGIQSMDDNTAIVAVSILNQHGKRMQDSWFLMRNPTKDYWMHLFWAYEDAEGTIQNISIKEGIKPL